MDLFRNTQEMRQERFQARAKTARKYARLTFIFLLGASVYTVWHERALSPKVHDGLQTVATQVGEWIENSEGARGYLTAMTNFSGNGSQEKYDPITRALLKLRQ